MQAAGCERGLCQNWTIRLLARLPSRQAKCRLATAIHHVTFFTFALKRKRSYRHVLFPYQQFWPLALRSAGRTNTIHPTIMSNKEDLPSNDSPNLALLEQTPEEKIKIWKLNGQIWRGRLSLENYIRREEHLADQAFTRNGGIAYWVLTDSTKPPNERPILSSCESLRKRAFVKRIDGVVEEVISHGVGSVFCDPSLRSRGYARRMVVELGKKLDYWSQEEGRSTDFTVLYSDIGKVRECPSQCKYGGD